MSGSGSDGQKVGKALRQALIAELASAARHVDGSGRLTANDVHEARKSIRRVRAWLRWSADPNQPAVVALDAELKRARASLSQLRDAGSAIESIDRIKGQLDSAALLDEFQQWRAQLRVETQEAAKRFAAGPKRARLQRQLLAASDMLGELPRIGRRQVQTGTQKSLRRALTAAAQIDGKRSPALRHGARRRIRLLNLQLAQAQALGALAVDEDLAKRVDRLTKALGRENDLAVLLQRARAGANPCSAALRDWLDGRRLALLGRDDRAARRFISAASATD